MLWALREYVWCHSVLTVRSDRCESCLRRQSFSHREHQYAIHCRSLRQTLIVCPQRHPQSFGMPLEAGEQVVEGRALYHFAILPRRQRRQRAQTVFFLKDLLIAAARA